MRLYNDVTQSPVQMNSGPHCPYHAVQKCEWFRMAMVIYSILDMGGPLLLKAPAAGTPNLENFPAGVLCPETGF